MVVGQEAPPAASIEPPRSRSERGKIERKIERLVDAIAEETVADVAAVGVKLRSLEEKLSRLNAATDEPPPSVEWNPNAAKIYNKENR